MEKRKIKGTFKNHKKREVTTLMMNPQRDPWEGRTDEEEVMLDVSPEENLYRDMAPPKLISLVGNSYPLDPAEFAEDTGKRKVETCEEERKLQLNEPKVQGATNWAESTTLPIRTEADVRQTQAKKDRSTHHLTSRSDETVELQGSNLDYNSSLVKKHRVKFKGDELGLCTVGEIPLRIPISLS